MKRLFTTYLSFMLLLSIHVQLWAQAPAGYYDSAKNKNQKALLIALHDIIDGHNNVGYDGLWAVYKESDVRPNGKVWDMYSTSEFTPGQKQCGNYSYVGDCYNREHSFPKSWFSKGSPMVSDAFHIYPTDGKVNGQRSNYPYGETKNGTTLPSHNGVDALGKLGPCSFPDCSGTVFEPVDEYKGDFARTYFYMAARYQDKIRSWGGGMTAGNDYPCYKNWVINLLLKWHRQDPVSEKETNRNNAVYKYQHNRNPFIDYPELAEYVWGDNKNTGWTPGGVIKPVLIYPVNGEIINMGITAINREAEYTLAVKGQGLTEDLRISVTGTGFSSGSSSLDKDAITNGASIKIKYISSSASNAVGSLTLSNKDLTVAVQLTAKAVDGIPAREATNVGLNAFTAQWINVDGNVDYHLTVWDVDKGIPVYSENVPANLGKAEISGLTEETLYHYQLSYGEKVSNVIDVKTLTPVPVLSLIAPEEGLNFTTIPGTASEMKTIDVYTENIKEEITATVDAPFEISLNKSEWGQTLNLAAQGESFYIRLSATAAAGTHSGILSLETPTVDGDELEVRGVAALPVKFLEDFEEGTVGGYYNNVQKCTATSWNMKDVGLWIDNNDYGISARFGKSATSSITMNENKPNGASSVSFYVALYSSDSSAEIETSYSVDNGSTWTKLGSESVTDKEMHKLNYNMNVSQPVKIKIEQKSGKRLNLDNIAITDYVSTHISQDQIQDWDAYAYQGKLILEINKDRQIVKVFSANAESMYQEVLNAGTTKVDLPEGMYIVVCGERAKKVIIK